MLGRDSRSRRLIQMGAPIGCASLRPGVTGSLGATMVPEVVIPCYYMPDNETRNVMQDYTLGTALVSST